MNEKIVEHQNPFPYGSVAWSKWESEQERAYLHVRTIALLEGRLPVVDQKDIDYLRDMGGVRGERSGWPKKWCVCSRCHAEWQATGFPAPVSTAPVFQLIKNRFGAWFFPSVCEVCDAQLHAISPPLPSKEGTRKIAARTPYLETDL